MSNLTLTEIRNAMLQALEETALRFQSPRPMQTPASPRPRQPKDNIERDNIDEGTVRSGPWLQVRWSDLEMAFEYASTGGSGENQAYLCRRTGKIFYHSDVSDNFEDLPDDIEDDEKFIKIPHKNALGLGKRLVLEFASQRLSGDYDNVERMFGRKGAYARFDDLLDR